MNDSVKYSYSGVNTLRLCNRKFYFSTLLANHGRKVAVRRKAYELKHMQNLKMWQGSVVDKMMEKSIIPAIREKHDLDFVLFSQQAIELAKRQFKYSLHQMYKDPSLRKSEVEDDFCILDIHELGRDYTETELAETYAVIGQCVLNIPSIIMPDGQLLIEFLKECNQLVPNVSNWMVRIEQARLTPQIDLIAYHNWKPVVIDWKLSQSYSSDYSRQLLLCGLTIYLKRLENSDKQPYKMEDILLFEVNLLKSVVKEHKFSQREVNELIDYITLTSYDLKLLTVKGENSEINIEDFELTDDEGHCRLCNFRPLCSFVLLNDHFDEKSYTQFVQSNQFV